MPGEYRIQVATDSSFQSVAREKVTSDTSLAVEGLEIERTYFWRVRAENIVEGPWSASATFTTRASKIAIAVERSFGEAAGPADYRLAALPGDATRPLGQVVSGEAGTQWQAFWLTSTQPWTVEDSVDAAPLKNGTVASVSFYEEWNIISNPLGKAIAWSAVTDANGGGLQPLWAFDGSFAQADTFRSAKAGEAFYFLNDGGLDTLNVPYPSAPGAKAEAEAKSSLLAISARPKGSDGPTSTARIGFSEEAAEGLGPLDQSAPPGQFSALSLRLKTPGEAPPRQRLLATEHRPPETGSGSGQTFRLQLHAKLQGPL